MRITKKELKAMRKEALVELAWEILSDTYDNSSCFGGRDNCTITPQSILDVFESHVHPLDVS